MTKIRINFSAREIEIEGTEDFIKSYQSELDKHLESFKVQKVDSSAPPSRGKASNSAAAESGGGSRTSEHSSPFPETFGEYLHLFAKSLKDVDYILIAGNFAQHTSSDNSFDTNVASKLLIDQGIKLSNPSRSISLNIDTKKISNLQVENLKFLERGSVTWKSCSRKTRVPSNFQRKNTKAQRPLVMQSGLKSFILRLIADDIIWAER